MHRIGMSGTVVTGVRWVRRAAAVVLPQVEMLAPRVCVAALLITGACRPIAVVVTPPPSPPTAPIAPNISGPWNITSGQLMSYKLYVDVVVMARYIDSLSNIRPVFDSSSSEAEITWSNRTSTRWNGQLTSFSSGPSAGRNAPMNGVQYPVALTFSARTPEGPWVRTAPGESDCSVESAIAAIGREVVIPVPARIRRDAIWHDSSSITACRDSIPLEVTSVRRYRVLEAVAVGNDVQLLIERTTTTSLRGIGRQLGEPITITGRGSGTMRFTLARADGFIVTGEGEQTLDLRLEGRRRTQEVRQTTRLRVRRP